MRLLLDPTRGVRLELGTIASKLVYFTYFRDLQPTITYLYTGYTKYHVDISVPQLHP